MTLADGTSVRITAVGIHDARTGVVTETPLFWAEMNWRRVLLDPKPSLPTSEIFPAHELAPIAASKRTTQPAQASLFGGDP